MKEYIDIFDRKEWDDPRSIQRVIDKGMQSRTLRDNPVFIDAVKEIYWGVTLIEDRVNGAEGMGQDGKQIAEVSKRIARTRALLVDIVKVLDSNIFEAENALSERENQQEN